MGQSRNEDILENILGADNELVPPQSRNEALLQQMLGRVLPGVTPADDGKVPVVVDGKWTASDLPDGNLPIVTSADNGDLLGVAGGAWSKVSPENVTVGNAEQIVSKIAVEDRAPYNFRTAGGALEIGDRVRVSEITGATIAWNQMLPIPEADKSKTENGVTFTDNRDGTYTVSTTAEGATADTYLVISGVYSGAGHKYLWRSAPQNGSASTYYSYISGTGGGNDYGEGCVVYTNTAKTVYPVVCYVKAGTIITTPIVCRPQLHDLTIAFGSAIADRAYTMEQAEAGSGITWLKSYGFFTKDYYAYNAGSLESVVTSAHKTVGFNAFDPATNKAHVVGGNKYAFEGTYTSFTYVDINGDTLTVSPDGEGYYTFPSEGDLTFVGAGADLCVHLAWDGERDGEGEYEPYADHVYPLDHTKEWRGILTLDANNNIVADGDIYPPSGAGTRKYGIIDMGTLTWSYNTSSASYPFFNAELPNGSRKNGFYGVCDKYELVAKPYNSLTSDKMGALYGSSQYSFSRIAIRDSAYTDAATFKTAMSGVYLVYELATPTTETAEPYQETQIVDNWGTEQYTDYAYEQGDRDFEMPVGHVSDYPISLRDKIEVAPDAPATDGLYLMKRENGENSYEQYISPIPAPPTTDGTYVLKATVSEGAATLSWVAE